MAGNNMAVRNNIAALNVHRNMKNVGGMQMKASERLSSGYKINRASDDAAGLAISEKMRGQIRGLNMASKNVDDAISLVKTAEGGMQGIDDMLHRIRELLDFGSNDTNENNNVGTGDRQKIQDEIDQLVEEIDSMSERVEFNKKKLIDGSWQNTSEQLNNANDLVNKLSVEMGVAEANAAALINVKGTDKAALDAALDSLDIASDSYSIAAESFATAEATYNSLVNKYADAKKALEAALVKGNLSTDFSKWNAAQTTQINDQPIAGQIVSAMNVYVAAAASLGIDELGLGVESAAGASFTAAMDSLMALVSLDVPDSGALAAYADNWDDAMGASIVDGQGVSNFKTAQSSFAAAETEYQGYVSTADLAQKAYDVSSKSADDAVRASKNVGVKLSAAGTSLLAATQMHAAGNSQPLHFQIGANGGQSLFMSIGSLKSNTLGIGDGKGNTNINVLEDTGADITATIDVLDQALSYVTTERSKLGAAVNRMEYTQQSLDITSENVSDAESRIRDADMAEEMMNKTKADTLNQVAVAMMSQANQQPQSILQLLG